MRSAYVNRSQRPLRIGAPPGSGRGVARRGAVVAQVAIGLTTVVGFTALAVDVGAMYNAKAELQRAADATAMAAAAELGDYLAGDPMDRARQTAAQMAAANPVAGSGLLLAEQDVIFGRAHIDQATGRYVFEETQDVPNAVRVVARRTQGSPSGPVPLYFANIFGVASSNIATRATAVLTPRDIVVVADLSASHNDDSELRHYDVTDINLDEIWKSLPNDPGLDPKTDGLGFTSVVSVTDHGDGTSMVHIDMTSTGAEEDGFRALSHLTIGIPSGAWSMAAATAGSGGNYPVSTGTDGATGISGLKYDETSLGDGGVIETESFWFTIPNEYLSAFTIVATKASNDWSSVTYNLLPGPTFGRMDKWGTEPINASYDPTADAGLRHLPHNESWSDAELEQSLALQGYNAEEIAALMSNAHDAGGTWRARVATALGLAEWSSGIEGGLWELRGYEPGNGDTEVSWNNELVWHVEYPYSGGSWSDYFNYMRENSHMSAANENFKHRFGLKTFVNYLLEKQPGVETMPELAEAPEQPMKAVRDAGKYLVSLLEGLDGEDLLGTAAYGTVGYGPVDKPADLSWLTSDFPTVAEQIGRLQAGHWTNSTNIAQGIDKGVDVLLESGNARNHAAKVMILLTDGVANHTRSNPTAFNVSQARADTLAAAADARAEGVKIYTVSVGTAADQSLMHEVAAIGEGEWFHAGGTISEYEAQLLGIFHQLGGKRSVILIE